MTAEHGVSWPPLAKMEGWLEADRALCAGITMVTDESEPTIAAAVADGFTTFTWTACDGFGWSCTVNGITADWSETLQVVFEHHACNATCHRDGGRGWVEEDQTKYPGTSYLPWSASLPLWSVSDNEAGSGPVWSFATAYGDPDYVLVRDMCHVSVGIGPFNVGWD